jgi:hypothetical protein
VHQPRPRVAPRELPDDDAEYVLPSVAARATDVPLYTVRYWQRTGKVASRPSRYGRLVRLADVQERAAQAQRQPVAQRADETGEAAE